MKLQLGSPQELLMLHPCNVEFLFHSKCHDYMSLSEAYYTVLRLGNMKLEIVGSILIIHHHMDIRFQML